MTEKLTAVINSNARLKGIIGMSAPVGKEIEFGMGLKLNDNVLSADTVDFAAENEARPIASSAVYRLIGDIETVLAGI